MAGLGPHSGDGDVLIVATDHVAQVQVTLSSPCVRCG